MDTELTNSRMASTAAPSPPSLSPRPTQRPAAIAPASVTRTSSRARFRSGASRRAALMRPILPLVGPGSGAGILADMTTPPEPGQMATGHPGGEPEDAGHDGFGADHGGYAVPAPRPAKARLLQDGRDMFWSTAPLARA